MGAGTSKPVRGAFAAHVEKIFDHAADTRSLFLRVEDRKKLRFVPGQFVSVAITLSDETRTRAYSMASNSGDELIELCFDRILGARGAQWMFERRIGDLLQLTGPFGTFTMTSPPQVETIFVAQETAIAPIRPMLHLARAHQHAPIHLVWGARDDEHRPYLKEILHLFEGDPDFRLVSITPNAGEDLYAALHAGVAAAWVDTDTIRARQFYLCGIGKGVSRLRDLLRGAGYERRAVHYEQW